MGRFSVSDARKDAVVVDAFGVAAIGIGAIGVAAVGVQLWNFQSRMSSFVAFGFLAGIGAGAVSVAAIRAGAVGAGDGTCEDKSGLKFSFVSRG